MKRRLLISLTIILVSVAVIAQTGPTPDDGGDSSHGTGYYFEDGAPPPDGTPDVVLSSQAWDLYLITSNSQTSWYYVFHWYVPNQNTGGWSYYGYSLDALGTAEGGSGGGSNPPAGYINNWSGYGIFWGNGGDGGDGQEDDKDDSN
ncbi:hypothetical protein [Ekhidna sp.]|uniref:hypothetical protein n=1 Tax=Ekhidna sp. TaxID=2608089 RepID=UPI003BAA6D38